ncbi:MAG: hypothetical protein GYA23_11730 [Methanomicrobiales archaeon]|nr:hypothetical protein [Methanomicrobiales archaeon]
MNPRDFRILALGVLLLVAVLLCAGCTSIPGPDVRFTPSPTPTEVPVPTMVKPSAIRATTAPTPVAAASPSVMTTTMTSAAGGMYETRTCAQMEGSLVRPGEMCPGAWLEATDTFSCCSKAPRSSLNRNATVTVKPFSLAIEMDDDPGSILP